MEAGTVSQVILAMTDYYSGDCKRINHFLKVYSLAKVIGEGEGLPQDKQILLETAAVVHDIGIKISEEKYHSSAGKYQELEGPPEAERMLLRLGFSPDFIKNVCYLVARHHTYDGISGEVYRILVEADFIVNIFEDNLSRESVLKIRDKIFRTKTGLKILDNMYFQD